MGLTETEMIEGVEIERFRLSQILLAMASHLIRPEGYVRFSCVEFHLAAHRRYISDKQTVLSIHRRLAKYFQSGLNNERTAGALAWHLEQAGDLARDDGMRNGF
jgi:2-polyprenyl-3-methyl-5-hydroxy-6-metoxy-1,4-benzoquinol methylase